MTMLRQCVVVVALGAFCANNAIAQSDIEKLIEQTGIEADDVAMRDTPGWRAPKKIVVLDVFGVVAAIEGVLPGVELIAVRSEADAIAQAADADAIIGFCSDSVLSAAMQAVWVQIFGAGAERCLRTERILDGQVVLSNMQKMASPIIAEHVIAMTLALARRLPQFGKAMPSGEWLRGSEITSSMQSISGKTMLVVGLGGIGTRRSSREGPNFVDYVGLSDELFDLAGQPDFIVNALPLTPETTGLFNEAFFAAAKSGAQFINVGRGKSVVTKDLVAALQSGQIAGAGLDVTEPEPLPSASPLWQMDNVIITPHVSSRGGNRSRHLIVLRENLRRFAAGEALLNVVDPDLGY